MSPEEFEELLKPRRTRSGFDEADGFRLAEAVAGLTEAQRKKLSRTASSFFKQFRGELRFGENVVFAGLAVLAVCPLSECKKVGFSIHGRQDQPAIKILADRRPEWIDDWISHKLSQDFFQTISWSMLRALIRAGVCRKPEHPTYGRLMASDLGWRARRAADGSHRPVVEQLLADSDLLDDVWRVFGAEDYMLFGDSCPWVPAFIELTSRGILDRQRVLDCALKALDNDIQSPGRYARFYDAMKPTPEERAARQSRFLELLAHRESSIVGFALDELAALEKQAALDGDAFLNAVRPVFALKPKGQPLAALKLAGRLAGRGARYVPGAIDVAIEALAHDSSAVQEKAAELLQAHKDHLHRDHLAEIRDRMEGLVPPVRQTIQSIAGELNVAGQQVSADLARDGEFNIEDLQSRAAKLPEFCRRLAGIDEALQAIRVRQLPAQLSFDLLDVPLLTGVERVAPIETADELLDSVARGLETLDSGDEFERILDGIGRLCGERPSDFELRAAPLAKRLKDAAWQDTSRGLAKGPTHSVQSVIYAWLTGRALVRQQPVCFAGALACFDDLVKFVDARMEEIERRIFLRQPAPLLAAPTHRHGWVDPRAFVRRAKEIESLGLPVGTADLIQALLRLAPDGRSVALGDAGELRGQPGRAIRWALGGDEGSTAGEPAVWLAAGRCRNPRGQLKELAELDRTEDDYALHPPSYIWTGQAARNTHRFWVRGGEVPFKIRPDRSAPDAADFRMQPTLGLTCPKREGGWAMSDTWIIDWMAMIWPLNTDPFLAEGARALTQRVNSPASAAEPNHAYLAPLLEPDRPWSELAYLAEWIALVSKDADSRGSAMDALIAAVEDGRADWRAAADVLLRLLPGGWVKLNRVADACREISRVSPLHSWWVAEFLQSFVAGLEQAPRDLYHPLTLLVELLSGFQLAVNAPARERLATLSIPGRGAKAIEQLVGHAPAKISAEAKKALDQCTQSRIERAARWQGEGGHVQ
jgi:hypothetical protein